MPNGLQAIKHFHGCINFIHNRETNADCWNSHGAKRELITLQKGDLPELTVIRSDGKKIEFYFERTDAYYYYRDNTNTVVIDGFVRQDPQI